jgi:hypothetical protein
LGSVGWGSEQLIPLYINVMFMESFLVFIVLMSIVAIVYGIKNSIQIDVIFEIKRYDNPFYYIGVSFIEIEEEDVLRQEFVIGMFFINIISVFYKEKDGII